MNRLQAELQRLYLLPAPGAMLELARPADWDAIAALWRGVQGELGLPAPAIAINGRDGYQLWFAFAEALPAARVLAFLDALRRRYLAGIAEARVSMIPSFDGTGAPPQQQGNDERWSAFVAPDLAPVFAEEPWLDLLPGIDGQADLLARLVPIRATELQAALDRLGVAPPHPAPQAAPPPAGAAGPQSDPRAFLLKVMNDESVALALRIEAAKALL